MWDRFVHNGEHRSEVVNIHHWFGSEFHLNICVEICFTFVDWLNLLGRIKLFEGAQDRNEVQVNLVDRVRLEDKVINIEFLVASCDL